MQLLRYMVFFPECKTSTDCPDGGKNYICNNNSCECPIPKLLDGDKCVGMLSFEKENSQKHNRNF